MKYIFIFSLSIISILSSHAQNDITKTDLKKILKIDHGDDSKIWTICNSNSTDTIQLYSNMNYFYQSHSCCEFIRWNFYKKNKIREEQIQVCKEPSTGKPTTEKDYYSIKIKNEDDNLYLDKYYNNKLVIRYRVLSIIEKELPKQPEIKYQIIELAKVY